jgi:hypothetical protein
MNKKLTLAVLIALLLLGIVVVPAMAIKPLDVQINVPENSVGPIPDNFTASGPAVFDGILCPSGTVIDLDWWTSGPPAGNFRILHVTKQFTCDDDSGSFDVDLVVRLDLVTDETTANWKVVGGTGDYSKLKGNGKLIGTPGGIGAIIDDEYLGKLH